MSSFRKKTFIFRFSSSYDKHNSFWELCMKKILLIDPNIEFATKIKESLNPILYPLATIIIFGLEGSNLFKELKTSFNFSFPQDIKLIILHESFFQIKDDLSNEYQCLLLKETKQKSNIYLTRGNDLVSWKKILLNNLNSEISKQINSTNSISVLRFRAKFTHKFFQTLLLNLIKEGKNIHTSLKTSLCLVLQCRFFTWKTFYQI